MTNKAIPYTPTAQLNIVEEIIRATRDFVALKTPTTDQLTRLIESYLEELLKIRQSNKNHKEQLTDSRRLLNKMIAQLEQKDNASFIIAYLKRQGVYRILYHNPIDKGQELPQNDTLHTLLKQGFMGVGIAALSTLFFVAATIFAAPAWITVIATGLFVGTATYLAGLVYGVVNDLFATKMNLPYFLLGHQPQQTSLLRTNDPAAQGIAWGVAATYPLAARAGVAFAVIATITAIFTPLALYLLPVMMLAMPLIAIGAENYAQKRAKALSQYNLGPIGSNRYQIQLLNGVMCPTNEERASWHANSDRNMFGFVGVPLIGLGALVGLIGLSAATKVLPTALVASSLFTFTLPVVFAATAIIGLAAAGLYMLVNRNTQVDNRYKLNFESGVSPEGLYLDEDADYANELLETHHQRLRQAATHEDSQAACVDYQSARPNRFFETAQPQPPSGEEATLTSCAP